MENTRIDEIDSCTPSRSESDFKVVLADCEHLEKLHAASSKRIVSLSVANRGLVGNRIVVVNNRLCIGRKRNLFVTAFFESAKTHTLT